jgi:signal transduction histidine kinase
MTELKRAEQALARARDEILEASRLKSELLVNVSHDLVTPLNAIFGYADMLLSEVYGPLSEEQVRTVQRIMANARQLSSLINDLLAQAQVEASRLELKPNLFSPANLVKDVITSVGVQARAKGLALTSQLADDVPASLLGDPQRLRQILLSLVSNAIKFTAEGMVNICVFRPDASHWALQVSDTGCGIPDRVHSRIFDLFWQLDGSPTREHDGIGLGLALVKELVGLMAGRIELESKVGQGSTFTVILPLTIPQQEEELCKHPSR